MYCGSVESSSSASSPASGRAASLSSSRELARLSGELVRWNCAYQEALGIAECTANVDEVAPAG